MSIKTVLALKTALALTAALAATSTAAFAQTNHHRHSGWRTAPVQLNAYGEPVGVTHGEPKSFGAGHLPRAFYDQEQPGYPQSPPNGGGF